MLDRSERLTEQAPCWYLRYARLDDATALLRNAFIETDRGFSGPARKQQSVPAPAAENVAPASETPRPGAPGRGVSDERFVRRPDAFVRQGRGEFFLGKETGDEIFHLNPLGRAVWELLAEPLSEAEGVELLASVFPQTPRAQIERDVMNLFTAFQRETLMRHLLVYSSVTGNTRAVAEAIHRIMPPGTGIYPVRQAPEPDDYDFLALGFWTHRTGPDPLMSRYMEKVRDKSVGIFGTLAAYPDSEHAGHVIEAARALLSGNRIVGTFLCQGRLAPKRLERRMQSDGNAKHPMTPERRTRLLEAAKHPDAEDFARAQAAFAAFLQNVIV